MDRFELYTAWCKKVDEHRSHVQAAGELIGVSAFRLGNHDLTKYWEQEAEGYAYRFVQGRKDEFAQRAFEKAFMHHVHHNDHHWQHWCLGPWRIEIEPEALKEMVADWMGAGVSHSSHEVRTYDCRGWFAKSGSVRGNLHHKSLALVEGILQSSRFETAVKLLDTRLRNQQEDNAIVASPQAP